MKCKCGQKTTGWTTVKCCNICGLPIPAEVWDIPKFDEAKAKSSVEAPVILEPTNAELSQLLSMCKTKLLLYYTKDNEYIGGVPIDQLTFRIDKMQERLSK